MPESKTQCPKCDSHDILVGTSKEPNRCSDCDHSWMHNPAPIANENRKVLFKAPQILLTFNQDLRRRPTTMFETRLAKKLRSIRG